MFAKVVLDAALPFIAYVSGGYDFFLTIAEGSEFTRCFCDVVIAFKNGEYFKRTVTSICLKICAGAEYT